MSLILIFYRFLKSVYLNLPDFFYSSVKVEIRLHLPHLCNKRFFTVFYHNSDCNSVHAVLGNGATVKRNSPHSPESGS